MSTRNPILKFIGRTLLAALPALAMIAWYAIADPFGVVRAYRGHIPESNGITLAINYGYVSTESFNYYRDSMRYDSFIFGSSMSQYYKAEYWKRHLPKDAVVCHYDASMETIDGIINKIRYIHSKGMAVKHALIVIEEAMLHRQPQDNNFLYAQHYATTPGCDYLHFQNLYFNIFRNPAFLKFTINPGKYAPEMVASHYASADLQDRIENINESYYAHFDSLIACSPEKYFTAQRMSRRNYAPLPQPYEPQIKGAMLCKLFKLKELLTANGTDYLIIIPPRYHREQLNSSDLYQLQCLFGNTRVHDFSHDSSLSNDPRSYYDNDAHLISAKCKLLLDSCYEQQESMLESPYTRHRNS